MATIQSATDLYNAIDNQDATIELADGLDIDMSDYDDLAVAASTPIVTGKRLST